MQGCTAEATSWEQTADPEPASEMMLANQHQLQQPASITAEARILVNKVPDEIPGMQAS